MEIGEGGPYKPFSVTTRKLPDAIRYDRKFAMMSEALLHFQGQMVQVSAAMVRCDVLLRWTKPDASEIVVARFEVYEDAESIRQLGIRAAAQAAKLHEEDQ